MSGTLRTSPKLAVINSVKFIVESRFAPSGKNIGKKTLVLVFCPVGALLLFCNLKIKNG